MLYGSVPLVHFKFLLDEIQPFSWQLIPGNRREPLDPTLQGTRYLLDQNQ